MIVDSCPGTLKGKRDRALLSLGFAAALRRSELVALKVGDLVEVADGFRLTVRKSKTDQEGEGAEVAIPRGCWLRPVTACAAGPHQRRRSRVTRLEHAPDRYR
jgi:integrase